MPVITAVIRSAVRWWTGYWISMKIRQDKSWERNELGRVKNVGQNSTKRQDFMWLSKQSRPSCLERRGDWPKCFWRSQFQFWRLQLQPQSVTSKCILRARGRRSKIWGRLLRRTYFQKECHALEGWIRGRCSPVENRRKPQHRMRESGNGVGEGRVEKCWEETILEINKRSSVRCKVLEKDIQGRKT